MKLNEDIMAKLIARSIVVIGGIILFIGMLIYFMNRNEIFNNRAYTKGIILEYGRSGRTGFSVEYEYYVDGVLYVNSHGVDKLSCDVCLGAKFMVIYSKKNPEKSFLMATDKVFEMFNLKIPEKKEVD